tara:strand:+ start:293 stop:2767 length:2475 start_codon:yes stop_codon:yes gene_type:complete
MSNPLNRITAVLGPTNTGKTYLAIEKMLEFNSGIFGFPLRLLAREVYDKCVTKVGVEKVALITGEEKIIPDSAQYFICTVESMPKNKSVDFVAIDEIQMCADRERGHIFTDRLLNARGEVLTMFLGSQIMKNIISDLVPDVEFVNKDRFSKLTYGGYKKISRLDRKSALIAFSIEEVYALAELVRRQKGGAAIVMGSLSPKTRNAQVELYQSGDVDYLVATDAIGMGINMDIEQISFSSLKKFDGKKTRRLRTTEISQIAGRAGRYKNDGIFGVTGDCQNLEPDEIERIETHKLDDVKILCWRNSKLDFKDTSSLISSLELKPKKPNLIRISDSIDENVLRFLLKDKKLKLSNNNLELLWECCQIPDFQKKAYGQHIGLVSGVFNFLTSKINKIPNDFMKNQLKHLDKYNGNIDMITNRISNVRTWSYVANKKNWVENSDYWIELSKNIEDNLSEKLHQELSKIFIDKRISVLSRGLKQDAKLKTTITSDNDVIIDEQLIGRLKGLKLNLEFTSSTIETDIKSLKKAARQGIAGELSSRVKEIINKKEIELINNSKIYWKENPIAKIKKGKNYLAPEVEIISDEALDLQAKEELLHFLSDWLSRYIAEELNDLINLIKLDNKNKYLRALSFQLYENNGILKRTNVEDIVKAISKDERKQFKKLGIKIGRYHIFLPKMLKPKAVNLRILLWKFYNNISNNNEIPRSGLNFLVDDKKKFDKKFLLLCGFEKFKNFYIRVDILEKFFLKIIENTNNDGKFKVNSEMMNLLGCSRENFFRLMDLMNYRKENNNVDVYSYKGYRKEKSKVKFVNKKNNPFKKLMALNLK